MDGWHLSYHIGNFSGLPSVISGVAFSNGLCLVIVAGIVAWIATAAAAATCSVVGPSDLPV